MKRYQKQLLVYSLLVITSIALYYTGYELYKNSPSFERNEGRLKLFVSSEVSQLFLESSLDICNWYEWNIIGTIVYLLIAFSPVWIFSGYYFARNLNMPGVYSEGKLQKKELLIITALWLLIGLLIPVIRFYINMYPLKNTLFEYSFQPIPIDVVMMSLSIIIFDELLIRLFFLSFVSWLVFVLLRKIIRRDSNLRVTSVVFSTIIYITAMLLLNLEDNSNHYPGFFILIHVLESLLLFWLYFVRGVLTTVVFSILYMSLNYGTFSLLQIIFFK